MNQKKEAGELIIRDYHSCLLHPLTPCYSLSLKYRKVLDFQSKILLEFLVRANQRNEAVSSDSEWYIQWSREYILE